MASLQYSLISINGFHMALWILLTKSDMGVLTPRATTARFGLNPKSQGAPVRVVVHGIPPGLDFVIFNQ